MARKQETPFNKIMLTRAKLRMFVEFGDHALDGQTPQEFAADVAECLEYLMDFRNIVNGMVTLDEKPGRAALSYIDENDVRAVFGEDWK
jgi:hypothetical protein